MQSMFLAKENDFDSCWLKGDSDVWFMTFIIFFYLDTSRCWGIFFFFFFFFYSTSAFDLTVTLCNLGWLSGRPSKISRFSPNWQNTLPKAQAVWTFLLPGYKILELEIIYISGSFGAESCDVKLSWCYRTFECLWDAPNYLDTGLSVHEKDRIYYCIFWFTQKVSIDPLFLIPHIR